MRLPSIPGCDGWSPRTAEVALTTVYELDNEQAYEAEIRQCVGVTGYHHWFFLSALAEAHNYEFRAFAVDYAGERLGVVPLLFRRYGPVSTANFVPIGCIGPVIRGEALRAGLIGELLRAAGSLLRGHRTVATRWGFSPSLNVSADELANYGFEALPWENYVIPATKSVDDLLKSMSRSRRQSINRHIRRGQDRGVSVAEASAEEIMQCLPEQVSAVYERQGRRPLYNLTEARSLTERLASHPRMLWRTVKQADGNVVGVAGCVIDEERVWGWLITGTPVNGVSVQILCYWDLIKWSLARGLALDLGGAPNEGIRELKTSLGADIETGVRVYQFRPMAVYKAATALRNWGPLRANWARIRWMIGD
jgi:CelD/BcsL family acetyltransferase involved in cellulose biosynthesis